MTLTIILYLITVIVLLFLITILPVIISYFFLNRKKNYKTVHYIFSDDLFNGDYALMDPTIGRLALTTRGSVRFAHGKVITDEELNKKRQIVYSVELP